MFPPAPSVTRSLLVPLALVVGAVLATLGLTWGFAAGVYERALYGRTLRLAGTVILYAVPTGTLLAWLLARVRLPGRRLLLAAVATQLFIPLYLHAAAWEAGFGRLGWYSVAAEELDEPLLSGWAGAVWTHTVGSLAWVMVLVGAGLATTDRHAEEAALLDAGPVRTSLWIGLPQLIPWIAVAAVWIAVNVATEMTAADLYLVDTYAREIYTGFALGQSGGEILLRSAPAIVLTAELAAGGILLAVTAAPAGLASFDLRPRRLRLGRMTPLAAGIAGVWAVLMVLVPLGNLLYYAGWQVKNGASSWSLAVGLDTLALGAREFQAELFWSAMIGATTALVVVPIATLLACLLAGGRWRAGLVIAGLALLLAVPAPLLGMGLVDVLSRLPAGPLDALAQRSVLGPVLAAALRTLPWSTLLLWLAVRAVPRELLELARLEGAGRLRRFRYVVAPQLGPAFALTGVLVFGLAGSELAATILVAPPGMPTVAVRLFGLIHSGARDKEAALALWNVAASGMLGLTALLAVRRLLRRASQPTAGGG